MVGRYLPESFIFDTPGRPKPMGDAGFQGCLIQGWGHAVHGGRGLILGSRGQGAGRGGARKKAQDRYPENSGRQKNHRLFHQKSRDMSLDKTWDKIRIYGSGLAAKNHGRATLLNSANRAGKMFKTV
jgi:hypothetical protein